MPGLRGDKNARSSVHARDFADILSWGLHCRIRNSVGLYAWRPPPEELPFNDRGVLRYLAVGLSEGDDATVSFPPPPYSTCLDGWSAHPYV